MTVIQSTWSSNGPARNTTHTNFEAGSAVNSFFAFLPFSNLLVATILLMNSAILIWRTCLKDWNISHLNYFENILGEIFSFQKMHRHFWNSSSSTTTAGSFNKRHELQNILCKHLGRDHFDCTFLCILLILHSSTLSWKRPGWLTLGSISYSNWNIFEKGEITKRVCVYWDTWKIFQQRREYQEGLFILKKICEKYHKTERIPRGSVHAMH